MTVVLDIEGIPEAQARPKAYRKGFGVGVYSPKSNWRTLVAFAAGQYHKAGAPCVEGPTVVHLEFRMRRVSGLPKRREIPHVKKPDVDNVIKATVDALVPSLLADDRQVVEIHASKRYALPNEVPGCRVTIQALEESRAVAAAAGEEA